MNLIDKIRNEKINLLKNSEEIILSDYDLQLLMYDNGFRKESGTYDDHVWFKIYRNIALKTSEKYNIMSHAAKKNNVYNLNSLNLEESELLIIGLGETDDEIFDNMKRYLALLKNSKDVIGIKLDKKEIENLLYIIDNCKPTKEENDYYFSNINNECNSKIYYLKRNS